MTDEEREKQRKYDREYYQKMLPFQKEKRKEAARLRNRDKYWQLTDEERARRRKTKSLAYYYANIEALKIKAKAYRERKLKSKYE